MYFASKNSLLSELCLAFMGNFISTCLKSNTYVFVLMAAFLMLGYKSQINQTSAGP